MPKQQYLSRDNKGWKLRRRVPDRLQKVAGVTQWVERLSGLTFQQARERANRFGVKTDDEIKRLSRIIEHLSRGLAKHDADEPGVKFDLTDHEIDQIAIAYFFELETDIQRSGGYRYGVNEENRREVLVDLGQDYDEADALAVGDEGRAARYSDKSVASASYRTAIEQLIKYQFVDRQEVEEIVPGEGRQKGRMVVRLRLTDDVTGSPQFQRLANKLAQANAEIARRRLQANSENRHPVLDNPLFAPALQPGADIIPSKQVRIGELIDKYLAKRKQEVGPSRYQQLMIATRALQEEFGRGLAVSRVTRKQCQSIADLFVNIPAYAARHYKGRTLRKAADEYESKHGMRAQRHSEADKHLLVLREIFDYAVDQEWIDRSPVQRVKIVKPVRPASYSEQEEGYEPFTVSELKVIFATPLYTGCNDDEHGINRQGPSRPRRSRFWLPLISLFSGMRMQEILQLERSDVREVDGIYYISVNDKAVGSDYVAGEYSKRLKTKNALRQVPIHPELVRIGFLQFVARSEREWLFPESAFVGSDKLSDGFSKKFKTFMKPTGISVARRKVFHSFRNTFNDALREARVERDLRDQIMGWVDYKRMDSRYGDGHTLRRLHEEVSKVEYGGLDLSHLTSWIEG
ncbi:MULTISPECIES: site-specific integrase [unclassified Shinella]|uniref:site-specific integrase n=1 Tax=unclassified Shinella TaxID=2643062 RepID=UPI000A5A58F7|nr:MULTISPECIES: site-specific integrase [unclassified Shinella]